jgi:hypothetical protein
MAVARWADLGRNLSDFNHPGLQRFLAAQPCDTLKATMLSPPLSKLLKEAAAHRVFSDYIGELNRQRSIVLQGIGDIANSTAAKPAAPVDPLLRNFAEATNRLIPREKELSQMIAQAEDARGTIQVAEPATRDGRWVVAVECGFDVIRHLAIDELPSVDETVSSVAKRLQDR